MRRKLRVSTLLIQMLLPTYSRRQADILTWDVLQGWRVAVLHRAPIGCGLGTYPNPYLLQHYVKAAPFSLQPYCCQTTWRCCLEPIISKLHDSYQHCSRDYICITLQHGPFRSASPHTFIPRFFSGYHCPHSSTMYMHSAANRGTVTIDWMRRKSVKAQTLRQRQCFEPRPQTTSLHKGFPVPDYEVTLHPKDNKLNC